MPDSASLPGKLALSVEELRVTTGGFPASRKLHVPGRRHAEIRVAMREIDIQAGSGEKPVRAYDTSGPFSDPAVATDIRKGLAELRRPWILARGDVDLYEGRAVTPEDNGLKRGEPGSVPEFERAAHAAAIVSFRAGNLEETQRYEAAS